MRRMGSVTAPGIAQATYDAAVAKLVAVSEWVDLTATITTACAGAAASDPDSLAAGLTVTTTTGTFDGATIPCNSFAWTTHTTINDGYNETLNYSLGTIASLIPGYDPATHGVQVEADVVAAGTFSVAPLMFLAILPGGALAASTPGIGFQATATTNFSGLRGITSTSTTSLAGSGNPASRVGRLFARLLPMGSQANTWLQHGHSNLPAATSNLFELMTNTHSTSDALVLCIGQVSTGSGAISGLKIRFRVRTFEWANIDLSDLDLGCQA